MTLCWLRRLTILVFGEEWLVPLQHLTNTGSAFLVVTLHIIFVCFVHSIHTRFPIRHALVSLPNEAKLNVTDIFIIILSVVSSLSSIKTSPQNRRLCFVSQKHQSRQHLTHPVSLYNNTTSSATDTERLPFIFRLARRVIAQALNRQACTSLRAIEKTLSLRHQATAKRTERTPETENPALLRRAQQLHRHRVWTAGTQKRRGLLAVPTLLQPTQNVVLQKQQQQQQ